MFVNIITWGPQVNLYNSIFLERLKKKFLETVAFFGRNYHYVLGFTMLISVIIKYCQTYSHDLNKTVAEHIVTSNRNMKS